MSFLSEHIIEIVFGLISAGALAFCKYLYKQVQDYKNLLSDQEKHKIETIVDNRLEPILHELELLRKSIRDESANEQKHLELILASYRFRLMQLCKFYIRQGYMTQDQYDQLSEFYRIYHELGGNGQAQEYYDSAMKLEIKSNG